MEKILISRKDNEIRVRMTDAGNTKHCLQEISDEFQKFRIGHLTKDNVSELLSDPEGYIKQQVIENIKVPEMAGFAVKKELLVEQIELPDFGPIKELIKEVQRLLPHGLPQKQNGASVYSFDFNEGQVSINPGYEERITEEYSLYAETEKEVALYKQLESFIKAWKDLDQFKYEYCDIPLPTGQSRQGAVVPADLLDIKKQFVKLKPRLS